MASPASAAGPTIPPAVQLTYERAPGAEICPAEQTIRATLLANLGSTAIEATAGKTPHVLLRIRPHPGEKHQLEGHIEIDDADGRPFWSNESFAAHADCATLIDSLTLSLRVAADSLPAPLRGMQPARGDLSASPSGSSAPPDSGKPSPSSTRPSIFPRSSPGDPSASGTSGKEVRDPSPPPSFSIGVSAGALFGAAKATVPARVSLSLGVVWADVPRWAWVPLLSLLVEARGGLVESGTIGGIEYNITRWEGALVPCGTKAIFFACGILSAASVRAEVKGSGREPETVFRGAGGARLGLVLSVLSSLSVTLYGDIEVCPSPVGVQITAGSTWTESPLQGAFAAGVIGEFPGLQH